MAQYHRGSLGMDDAGHNGVILALMGFLFSMSLGLFPGTDSQRQMSLGQLSGRIFSLSDLFLLFLFLYVFAAGATKLGTGVFIYRVRVVLLGQGLCIYFSGGDELTRCGALVNIPRALNDGYNVLAASLRSTISTRVDIPGFPVFSAVVYFSLFWHTQALCFRQRQPDQAKQHVPGRLSSAPVANVVGLSSIASQPLARRSGLAPGSGILDLASWYRRRISCWSASGTRRGQCGFFGH